MGVEVIANTAKAIQAAGQDGIYHCLNQVGLHHLVDEMKQGKIVKEIVDQLSNKIDDAKEEIISKIIHESRRQQLNDWLGDIITLKSYIHNHYDAPSKEGLNIALAKSDEIIGRLTAHLYDDSIDKDIQYLTRIFSLYVVAKCLYCMIQFDRISHYAASQEERNAIARRVGDEIENAFKMYNKISDRLYQKTSSHFTGITTRLHEPPTNWGCFFWPWWRTSYYVCEYKQDGVKQEAKAVECKIYHPRDYQRKYGSRKDIIMKTTLDGGHFVWEERYDKSEALRQAEAIRMNEI